MDERGLWELFCKTGLPAVWLASALSVTAGLLAAWALGRVWRT